MEKFVIPRKTMSQLNCENQALLQRCARLEEHNDKNRKIIRNLIYQSAVERGIKALKIEFADGDVMLV
jgi:flagellar biosynthesis/type III secretory pathway chaperone